MLARCACGNEMIFAIVATCEQSRKAMAQTSWSNLLIRQRFVEPALQSIVHAAFFEFQTKFAATVLVWTSSYIV
jgi:hypothetical protein